MKTNLTTTAAIKFLRLTKGRGNKPVMVIGNGAERKWHLQIENNFSTQMVEACAGRNFAFLMQTGYKTASGKHEITSIERGGLTGGGLLEGKGEALPESGVVLPTKYQWDAKENKYIAHGGSGHYYAKCRGVYINSGSGRNIQPIAGTNSPMIAGLEQRFTQTCPIAALINYRIASIFSTSYRGENNKFKGALESYFAQLIRSPIAQQLQIDIENIVFREILKLPLDPGSEDNTSILELWVTSREDSDIEMLMETALSEPETRDAFHKKISPLINARIIKFLHEAQVERRALWTSADSTRKEYPSVEYKNNGYANRKQQDFGANLTKEEAATVATRLRSMYGDIKYIAIDDKAKLNTSYYRQDSRKYYQFTPACNHTITQKEFDQVVDSVKTHITGEHPRAGRSTEPLLPQNRTSSAHTATSTTDDILYNKLSRCFSRIYSAICQLVCCCTTDNATDGGSRGKSGAAYVASAATAATAKRHMGDSTISRRCRRTAGDSHVMAFDCFITSGQLQTMRKHPQIDIDETKTKVVGQSHGSTFYCHLEFTQPVSQQLLDELLTTNSDHRLGL